MAQAVIGGLDTHKAGWLEPAQWVVALRALDFGSGSRGIR